MTIDRGESDQRVPRRSPSLLERDLGDAAIVMTGTGDRIHTLKGSALFVWRLIDGNRSMDELRKQLTDEYEVSEERAEQDLGDFLETMKKESIISID